jgi:RNA recognition motif-containing protein
MNTHIHVSGLSYFCTDDTLRQAFQPFGTVVFAQVLRDEYGHSLGLGVVHMASSEDVERVFSAHQRFEVSGNRVDLWEPAESDSRGERIVAYGLRDRRGARQDRRAARADQNMGHEKSQNALQPLAGFMRRLLHTLVPSSGTVRH